MGWWVGGWVVGWLAGKTDLSLAYSRAINDDQATASASQPDAAKSQNASDFFRFSPADNHQSTQSLLRVHVKRNEKRA